MTSKTQFLAVALVLAALLAVSGVSQASCGSSQRVAADGVCLNAGWENSKSCIWGTCRYSSSFRALSRSNGKVVAKIDTENHPDKTWHLNYNGHARSSTAEKNIRGVYCCKDISAANNYRTS